jgi:hypothetical protein
MSAKECDHPPERLYAWVVNDALGKDLCVVCLDCHKVLNGQALTTTELEKHNERKRV